MPAKLTTTSASSMFAAASVPDLILSTARDSAIRTREALWADGETLDYRALADRIARASGMLLRLGLRRGERVALLAGRTADAVTGVLGIMAAGGAACVLDPRLSPSDLAGRLKDAGIRWLLADAPHAAHAAAAALALVRLEDAARAKPRTVGTALAGQRIAVLAPGDESALPAGAEGEIVIAGPSVMKGYVPLPAEA